MVDGIDPKEYQGKGSGGIGQIGQSRIGQTNRKLADIYDEEIRFRKQIRQARIKAVVIVALLMPFVMLVILWLIGPGR